MPRWTVDAPTRFDFDDVTALQVRLIDGTVAVLATDDSPSVVVSGIHGRPLQVSYEDGALTIGYEVLSWERLLDWLNPVHDSAAITITVPGGLPDSARRGERLRGRLRAQLRSGGQGRVR